MKKICISLFFLFASFIAFAGDNPVKIAIIGETDKFQPEIDALTIELSKKHNLIILERSDIDKILEEQSIILSDISKSSIRIGKLLGADGIILIKGFESGGNKYVGARLVAVRPGAIVDACVIPTNTKSEVYDLNKAIITHLSPLFDKLKISREDAVPISLLNFRASSPDPALVKVEKELNLIAAHRLMMEKNIFVNERWNMGQVEFEKALDEEDLSFWTGSYILEGNISGNNDALKVSIIVRKKNGDKHESLVEGKASDLANLYGRIVTQIISELKLEGQAMEWDMGKEAKEYYDEGIWALNNGLYDFSQSALDSAWALGYKNTDCSIARIKAYCNGMYVKANFPKEDKWISINMTFGIPIIKIPPEQFVDPLIYALQMYSQVVRESPKEKDKILRTGVGLLRFSSVILHSAYEKNLQKDNKYGLKLREIRSLTRECFNLTLTLIGGTRKLNNDSTFLYTIFVNYAQFWHEDINQTVDVYRKIINGTYPGTEEDKRSGTKIRNCFIYNYNYDIPRAMDWQFPEDYDRIRKIWAEFLDSLVKSDNDLERIAGIIMRSNDNKRNSLSSEIKDVVWNSREIVVKENTGGLTSPYSVIVELIKNPELMLELFHDFIRFYIQKYKENPEQYLFWQFLETFNISITKYGDSSRKVNIEKLSAIYDTLTEFKSGYPDYFASNRVLDGIYRKIEDAMRSFKSIESNSDVIKPTRFILVKDSLKLNNVQPTKIYNTKMRAGKIWCVTKEVSHSEKSYSIVGFSPPTLECERYEIPKKIDNHIIWEPKFEFRGNSFLQITDSDEYHIILVLSDNKIISYSKVTNSWRFIAKDSNRNIQSICYDKKTLFAGFSPDSKFKTDTSLDSGVISLDLATGTETIIASTRRKPPVTPLDEIYGMNVLSVFIKDSTLFVEYNVEVDNKLVFKACLYSHKIGADEWNLVTTGDHHVGLMNGYRNIVSRTNDGIKICNFDRTGIKEMIFQTKCPIGFILGSLIYDGGYVYITPLQNPDSLSNTSTVLSVIDRNGQQYTIPIYYENSEKTTYCNFLAGLTDNYIVFTGESGIFDNEFIAVVSKEKILENIKKQNSDKETPKK